MSENPDSEEKTKQNGEDKEVDEQITLQRKLIKRIRKLSRDMENFNIAEYVNMVNDPKRYLRINFIGGIARGLGFALGATIFAAVFIYVLQRMMVLNLPVIGDFISDIVKIVQEQL